MGDKYYAHEKFSSAVRRLAVTDGSRRDALREAYREISPVSVADLPRAAVEDFIELKAKLTGEDLTGEGTLVAALNSMSDGQARVVAGLIFDVCDSLQRAIIDAQRSGERWGLHHPDTHAAEH